MIQSTVVVTLTMWFHSRTRRHYKQHASKASLIALLLKSMATLLILVFITIIAAICYLYKRFYLFPQHSNTTVFGLSDPSVLSFGPHSKCPVWTYEACFHPITRIDPFSSGFSRFPVGCRFGRSISCLDGQDSSHTGILV